MNSNGSLLVLINPYASIWVFVGLYRSLFVPMDSNGSLWVVIGPCSSL